MTKRIYKSDDGWHAEFRNREGIGARIIDCVSIEHPNQKHDALEMKDLREHARKRFAELEATK